MKLSRLYIENFMCHEKSYVDFSQFSSALIVGKVENNELYSNGVGKTSIFKAIEYGLFNQADINLEKIIRDDTAHCRIVMDFWVDNQEYRISRKRTKKGSTDLTLLQRNSTVGTDEEVYHTLVSNGIYEPIEDDDHKYWKDISCRRAADTEKELDKLIKINFKSFRSTVHFLQNDFTGLTTSTPEKRKSLLKDALNLLVYAKLEKIAKDKSNLISRDIDKHKALIESIGDLDESFAVFQNQLVTSEKSLQEKLLLSEKPTQELSEVNDKIRALTASHKELETKYSGFLIREKSLISEKDKIDLSVKEYQGKKTSAIKLAKEIINEVKSIKENIEVLTAKDYSQIEVLLGKISEGKDKLAHHNVIVQTSVSRYEELKIPVPDENLCKHCRQLMTEDHKKACKAQISQEMLACQNNIQTAKKEISNINTEIGTLQQNVTLLTRSKQQLDDLTNKLVAKNRELTDKKSLHGEYSSLVEKFTLELTEKETELLSVQEELKNSSMAEAKEILSSIEEQKKLIVNINGSLNSLAKEIAHLNATKAVAQHNIDQNSKDKVRLSSLKKRLAELEEKFVMYPHVCKAFSSIGIPNLIIQNVLDDLQQKSNELLTQLKPGLQLSFFIEKTKGDGTETDTLDIHYHVHGRERYYEQLSGAMKLAVTFSLKLGLSFLLQEMIGTDIRFLLLDEIDQSLDKASVDAFADIVKFFQKDFTILIITHNDRLKDKFSHAICVEQDTNMISRAKVVSSW